MLIETQQDKLGQFEKRLSEFVSDLAGHKIESKQTLLAMLTKSEGLCILTQGDPDVTIMLALGAILQVYETQVDQDAIDYPTFCESIKRMLATMDDVMMFARTANSASTNLSFGGSDEAQ